MKLNLRARCDSGTKAAWERSLGVSNHSIFKTATGGSNLGYTNRWIKTASVFRGPNFENAKWLRGTMGLNVKET